MEDATRRTILADELLSDTGKRLLEVTQSNADGFAGLAAQAEAAGRIMSTDTVSSITRMNSAFVELKDRGLGLAMGLFEDIAPVLADAAESVLGFVDVLQEDGLAGCRRRGVESDGQAFRVAWNGKRAGQVCSGCARRVREFRRIPMEF